MWVLGIQAQILLLVWQVFACLKHLPTFVLSYVCATLCRSVWSIVNIAAVTDAAFKNSGNYLHSSTHSFILTLEYTSHRKDSRKTLQEPFAV